MSNPISHLPTKWNELTRMERWEVIQAFCESNRYDFEMPSDTRTPLVYFATNYFDLYILKDFFQEWQS